MTKEQILKRAKDIAKHNSDRCIESDEGYGITCAMDMAEYIFSNMRTVGLAYVYSDRLPEKQKTFCVERQKEDLLKGLRDFIDVKEEHTINGAIVRMKINVLK